MDLNKIRLDDEEVFMCDYCLEELQQEKQEETSLVKQSWRIVEQFPIFLLGIIVGNIMYYIKKLERK
jgi:hypothetical protein